jgi:hypothetical protein
VTDLAKSIVVERTGLRSINLERDLGETDVLKGYVLAPRAIDALQQIAGGLQRRGAAPRAWSMIGPYGSGKSAFAHLLNALLSGDGSSDRRRAEKIVREADPELLKQLRAFRRRSKIPVRGVIPAVSTARRESVSAVVLRAIDFGAATYWSGKGRKAGIVRDIQKEAGGTSGAADPERVYELFDGLLAAAPVALVIDEFGKCLEYAAQSPSDGDLYLLQRIAERLSDRASFAGLLLTLQHLAFEDYAGAVSAAQRREWRKIQGRFEELPFHNDSVLGWRVIASSISPPTDRALAERSQLELDDALMRLGQAADFAPEFADLARRSYPLHPLALWVLPDLASRFGQRERTLAGFLTGEAPGSLQNFLRAHDAEQTPLLGVAELWEYFAASGNEAAGLGEEGSRLRETQLRLEQLDDYEPLDRICAKTIAVLNLVASEGDFRASREVLEIAIRASGDEIRDSIARLEGRGVVVYRGFADEYRIWRGSDFDLAQELDRRREELEVGLGKAAVPVEHLSGLRTLRPLVASRHSQETGTLRYFEQRYAMPSELSSSIECAREADGLVLYTFGDLDSAEAPANTVDGKPLVVVQTDHSTEVVAPALDAAAAHQALKLAPELNEDPVARAEVRHRLVRAHATVSERLDAAFSPGRPGVMWTAAGKRVELSSRRDISRLVSRLCDSAYPKTPQMKSEMLNRRELTSQGAKARRELIDAMLTRPSVPDLGLEGFGPERAMYLSILGATGIHRERGDRLSFGPPKRGSGLTTAWNAIEGFFDSAERDAQSIASLYAALMSPPFGMKEGPIPVLLSAALLYRHEDVLVYEDGTFQPRLGPEHIERLIKTPNRFAVKRLDIGAGRASVFASLRELLSAADLPEARNAGALSVVRPLIMFAQGLPEYTRRTETLSEHAVAVREVLFAAKEPDDLLFVELPAALGIPPIPATASPSDQDVRDFTAALAGALRELEAAYASLLDKVAESVRNFFGAKGPPSALREDLRARSRHLTGDVIEPRTRSFLLVASDEVLGDSEWLEALAMNVAGRPPQSWRDADFERFEVEARERAEWFRRLELLHYGARQQTRKGFEACKVTLTKASGEESSDLAWIDKEIEDQLARLGGETVDRVAAELGESAVVPFLAVLAQRVLDPESSELAEEVTRLESAA